MESVLKFLSSHNFKAKYFVLPLCKFPLILTTEREFTQNVINLTFLDYQDQ